MKNQKLKALIQPVLEKRQQAADDLVRQVADALDWDGTFHVSPRTFHEQVRWDDRRPVLEFVCDMDGVPVRWEFSRAIDVHVKLALALPVSKRPIAEAPIASGSCCLDWQAIRQTVARLTVAGLQQRSKLVAAVQSAVVDMAQNGDATALSEAIAMKDKALYDKCKEELDKLALFHAQSVTQQWQLRADRAFVVVEVYSGDALYYAAWDAKAAEAAAKLSQDHTWNVYTTPGSLATTPMRIARVDNARVVNLKPSDKVVYRKVHHPLLLLHNVTLLTGPNTPPSVEDGWLRDVSSVVNQYGGNTRWPL